MIEVDWNDDRAIISEAKAAGDKKVLSKLSTIQDRMYWLPIKGPCKILGGAAVVAKSQASAAPVGTSFVIILGGSGTGAPSDPKGALDSNGDWQKVDATKTIMYPASDASYAQNSTVKWVGC